MYSNSGNSTLEANKGSLDGIGAGKQVGYMTGISIDASGKIYGKYDNGDSRLLGQIAVATFSNPAGMEAIGNSMYAATQNSGDFDGIGQDPTQGGGSLTTGVLEMSNVDLSAQFTDMITTQRGFQANSRIITTSDSLLEELINLKR
jgi:flagellar hook protein FlgE